MPIYSFKCRCGNAFDYYFKLNDVAAIECSQCGGLAHKDFIASVRSIHTPKPFEPYFHYGLGVQINSMKQLKDECKKRNMRSPYADGDDRTEKGATKQMEMKKDRPRKVFSVGE